MSKEDNSNVSEGWILGLILVIFIGSIFYPDYIELKKLFIDFWISINWFYAYYTHLFSSAYQSLQIIMPLAIRSIKFYTALFLIFLVPILIVNYKLTRRFIRWQDERVIIKRNKKLEKENLIKEREGVIKILEGKLGSSSSHELFSSKLILERVRDNAFYKDIKEQIDEKIRLIKLKIPVAKSKEDLFYFKNKVYLEESKFKEREERVKQKDKELREFEETSLNKLKADDNNVYVESDLTEKEKTLLMKHGYKRAFEYCVYEQNYIRVLVKPTMKHSITHTFLVWSTMRLLRNMREITGIHDWDTREADITFIYKKKRFAIEIETGTILSKKLQLRAKIDYLNTRYKDHWLIIVSKKSLLAKYSKFGPVSPRAEVEKRLKKVLKNP